MGKGYATLFLAGGVALGAVYYAGPGPGMTKADPAPASGGAALNYLAAESSAGPAKSAQTPTPFIATIDNEHAWRADVVPEAWPQFTKLPNSKPLPAKSTRQKIDLGKAVNARWKSFYEKTSAAYPTLAESNRAVEYMLTIDPKAQEFPEAWGVFIDLRKVDRSISSETALDRGRKLIEARAKDRGVSIGMTADQVRASNWGRPKSINETITARGKREQWVYSGGYLYLEDGVLTSIQTSR